MRILRDGDAGVALAKGRGRVPIVYRYRDFELESGTRIRNVLLGVDPTTGEVLVVPAQSTAKIRAARAAKDESVEARISAELEDVIALIADRYDANPKKIGPAIVRYYIGRASKSRRLEGRLKRLANTGLAKCTRRVAWKVRLRSDHAAWLQRVADREPAVTQSDMVRGILVAAKEDVLDASTPSRRTRELEAAALAV